MRHAYAQTLCGYVAVTLVVSVGLAAARSFHQARVAGGWYGETLPAGVRKGTMSGEYLHEKDKAVLVYVPAGVFVRGTSAAQVQALVAQFGEYFTVETPLRSIYLSAYYMDKFEVTNQQYAQFLAALATAGWHYAHPQAPPHKDPTPAYWHEPPAQWSNPTGHWGGLVRCVCLLSLGGAPSANGGAMGKGCPRPQRPGVSLGEGMERHLFQQCGIDLWTAYFEP